MKSKIILTVLFVITLFSCAQWDNDIAPYIEGEHNPELIGKWVSYEYRNDPTIGSYVIYTSEGMYYLYYDHKLLHRRFWKTEGNKISILNNRGRKIINNNGPTKREIYYHIQKDTLYPFIYYKETFEELKETFGCYVKVKE
ncbi:hypothetical protein K5X82_11110 [Halosquirtibacter xylanolyticus]|uniref:hypothetical protein n=1 Tax=Halosquirtibacter xylanolyticus TaxID=3374599 RepID=UPI0037479F5A|nr:hypothetical protein K5X82_11110 [Prolixibacteraceae bacterium]